MDMPSMKPSVKMRKDAKSAICVKLKMRSVKCNLAQATCTTFNRGSASQVTSRLTIDSDHFVEMDRLVKVAKAVRELCS